MNQTDHRQMLYEKFPKETYMQLQGAGLSPRLWRLLKSNRKYVEHCLMRLGLLPKRDVLVKTFWGKEMLLPLVDTDVFSLYAFGTLAGHEYKLTQFFVKSIRGDDIFYDVGANYGFYTALAAELIDKGEIHAFEPNPNVYPYLEHSFRGEAKHFAQQIALSNKDGDAAFFDSSEAYRSGHSTLVEEIAFERREQYVRKMVSTLTLDSYTKTHASPTILKVDVEGAENLVIRGGAHTMEKACPIVVLEVWWRDGYNRNSLQHESLKILHDFGYSANQILDDGELKPVSFDKLHTVLLPNTSFDNFVFLR